MTQQDQNGPVWEPQAADSRLAQTAGTDPSGVFTSDLSVSEYVLTGRGRLRAARLRRRLVDVSRRPADRAVEPQPGTAGLRPGHVQRPRVRHGQDARRGRPPGRRRHRRRAAAHADVCLGERLPGIRGHRHRRPAPGRAGRASRARHGRAFTSDLSAQDFFRLLAAGAVPVSFVLGTCVYHIAHRSIMQSLRQAYQNQEMMQFTQGAFTLSLDK